VKFPCGLSVDGKVVNSFKDRLNTGWQYDASFRMGPHVCVVKNAAKLFYKYEANLFIDGVLLDDGKHTVISQPGPTPIQPPVPTSASPSSQTAQPAPSSQGPVPFYPVLPAHCSTCQAPLRMNTVNWTGPMSASCPHCGSGVKIKWERIGE
jgi:hypothetical protein